MPTKQERTMCPSGCPSTMSRTNDSAESTSENLNLSLSVTCSYIKHQRLYRQSPESPDSPIVEFITIETHQFILSTSRRQTQCIEGREMMYTAVVIAVDPPPRIMLVRAKWRKPRLFAR